MSGFKSLKILFSIFLLAFAMALTSSQSVLAVQVVISDVPVYGYNTVPVPDGDPEIMGCGPTSGVMILDTYDNRGATGLILDPLSDARLMHNSYMNTNAAGFGPASDFQFGVEDFAYDRGYLVDALLHVEPTGFNPVDWPAYTVGNDIVADANFWNTTTWDILDSDFLDFIDDEINVNRPVVLTVDSDGIGTVDGGFYNGTDHWMVCVGYDTEANQWAGYNTWDVGLHWYDVTSAFADGVAPDYTGNVMGIGFVRTVEFQGAIPEPATMLLLGTGLLGLAGFYRKRIRV